MEVNRVYHLDNRIGLPQLPEKCCQLLISDPPYYKVKGDFDFVWKSFDEYLEFMEGQAKLYKRILADNGTLFVYGGTFNISYVQVIFDKYFSIVNSLVWNKKNAKGREYAEHMRMFAPCTERILMYKNDKEPSKNCFKSIMDYIRGERAKCGWSYMQMDEYLGIKASSCYWDKETSHEYVIPTKENWVKLQETGYFKKEYEQLEKEYEELRRPFNNIFNYTEVLEFRNYNPDIDHDTVKPEKLTRALILTCSRPNDLVVIPFAGSGTECAMSAKEGRRFIGFETTEKHVTMSNKRAQKELSQPNLFNRA